MNVLGSEKPTGPILAGLPRYVPLMSIVLEFESPGDADGLHHWGAAQGRLAVGPLTWGVLHPLFQRTFTG